MTDCVWIHYARPRPHWYALDASERSALEAEWRRIATTTRDEGAIRVGTFHIRGQHDFETVEIWRFPTAEAAFDHWARLTAARYGDWVAFANNIGLEAEAE